ncbi:J domain-containing protein [Pontibacter oryzae]|uniref:J domain-containing protein n=1 Tax=Pontibacter oryzae TaxID=2304593 RepID=A0A399S6B8_9BACT|nr:J domain-containing protein [Pontibacter oryzae]RIJ37367.1 J domain-containing protein [Pontibacter oryzae]
MQNPNTPARSFMPQIPAQAGGKLGKLQEQFNKKTQQIEKLKLELAAKRESINLAQKRVDDELKPLIAQIVEQQVILVQLLDEAYALPFFRKREKEKLADLIAGMAFDLIDKYGRQDLVPLHDKYAPRSFEESIAQVEEDARQVAEDIFSTVFGFDEEPDEPYDFENIQDQLDREAERREQEKQNRQKSRKTKAQQAKEDKAKAELSNIGKACRRVYTELAKQLHPDKEQNETERAWKEEAMKQVTQAYHNDDFFELLRLQMEFLHLHQDALGQLPDDQLKYYIKLLSDQVQTLEDELDDFLFGPDGAFYEHYCGTPKQMNQKFKQAKDGLGYELQRLRYELRLLQDPQEIRNMLKEV